MLARRVLLLISLLSGSFTCMAGLDAPAPAPTMLPAADYHVHLVSPLTAEVLTPTPKPALENIPDALADLLRRREQTGEASLNMVRSLYTSDAIIRARRGGGWVGGEQKIALALLDYVPGFKLLPVAYELKGENGSVAGYFERGGRHGATFQFSLRQTPSGWRIAVDNIVPVAPTSPETITAADLINELDEAGIQRAVVLGLGYFFGSPSYVVEGNEETLVREENDWTIEQARQFPDRLVAFCGVNPLKSYAVRELERCSKIPIVTGIKLHFGASMISLRKPDHLARVRHFFSAANRLRMPIGAHIEEVGDYGREQAEIFLSQVLIEAPAIPVQIMHIAGSGPGYNQDDAFKVFAEARRSRDPRMDHVYVDVASMAVADSSPESLELIATRLRQYGLDHVLFGSDRVPRVTNEAPKTAWASFLKVPLTDEEFGVIASNVAPYLAPARTLNKQQASKPR